MQINHAGEVCYEPAHAVIEKYGNASEKERAKCICFYLLNDQKKLIEMLPEGSQRGNHSGRPRSSLILRGDFVEQRL